MSGSNAEHQRRWRDRQRRGLVVWRLEVPETELAGAFIDAGLVSPDSTDADDYHRAAVAILLQWASHNSVRPYARWLDGRVSLGAATKDKK